jgi:hypothetical protein
VGAIETGSWETKCKTEKDSGGDRDRSSQKKAESVNRKIRRMRMKSSSALVRNLNWKGIRRTTLHIGWVISRFNLPPCEWKGFFAV